MNSRGILRAGGYPVHRVSERKAPVDADAAPKTDAVPIIERYQDAAKAMHRTFMVPRADRWIVGCACGWATLSSICSSGRAQVLAQTHALDEADKLYSRLEERDPNGD